MSGDGRKQMAQKGIAKQKFIKILAQADKMD